MQTSELKIKVLTPDEGKVLTQAEEVELCDRIYSDKIYLAVNDSVDNYKEITEEEAEEYRIALQALIAAENEQKAVAD